MIQAKTNNDKKPVKQSRKKHLRPELRRETSALWKVPHNRANTKIINEHLSIKSSIVTDFVQLNRTIIQILGTLEQILQTKISSFKQNIFFFK